MKRHVSIEEIIGWLRLEEFIALLFHSFSLVVVVYLSFRECYSSFLYILEINIQNSILYYTFIFISYLFTCQLLFRIGMIDWWWSNCFVLGHRRAIEIKQISQKKKKKDKNPNNEKQNDSPVIIIFSIFIWFLFDLSSWSDFQTHSLIYDKCRRRRRPRLRRIRTKIKSLIRLKRYSIIQHEIKSKIVSVVS